MSRSLWPGFDPPTTRPAAPSESTEDKQRTLFVLCSQYVLFDVSPLYIKLAPLTSDNAWKQGVFARKSRAFARQTDLSPEVLDVLTAQTRLGNEQ